MLRSTGLRRAIKVPSRIVRQAGRKTTPCSQPRGTAKTVLFRDIGG
jgi:hypothetical protein